MNRLVRIFVAACFVSVSDQAARFVRLPDGYWTMSSGGPSIQTRARTQQDCGIKATVEELNTGNVARYIFSETSDPNCDISTSSINNIFDNGAVAGDAYYVKIPDDVAYEGKCAGQDVKRLVEAINATYATTARESTLQTTTTSVTLIPEACRPTNAGKEVGVYLDKSADTDIIARNVQATVSCPCDDGTKKYWPAGETPKPFDDKAASYHVWIRCSDLSTACIFAEDGTMWTAGNPAPIHLLLYPYCEPEPYGCHMYLEHSSTEDNSFLQSGKVVLNESIYSNSNGLVDLGHNSPYIKAAAISLLHAGDANFWRGVTRTHNDYTRPICRFDYYYVCQGTGNDQSFDDDTSQDHIHHKDNYHGENIDGDTDNS